MRIELLEKVSEKKAKIQSLINNSDNVKIDEILRGIWTNYEPSIEKPENIRLLVSDGSYNKEKYIGYYLYVFGGYATLLENENIIGESFVGDVDISLAKGDIYIDSIAKMYMFLSEAKSIYNIAKKNQVDVIIFDGTISSRFITFFPSIEWFNKSYSEEKINSIVMELSSVLIEKIDTTDDIVSIALDKEIKNVIRKYNMEERLDIIESIVSKLAYLEFFVTLSKMFNLEYKPLIVGLAKRSDSTRIFNSALADIRILYYNTYKIGYTETMDIDSKEIKWKTSVLDFITENFDINFNLKMFFARFKDNENIYPIEIYNNNYQSNKKIQEYLIDIIDIYEVSGYPVPLVYADKEVRITSDDMDTIKKILELENEINGREVLER